MVMGFVYIIKLKAQNHFIFQILVVINKLMSEIKRVKIIKSFRSNNKKQLC